MANEVEIVVSKKNKANLGELGDDAKKAGKEVEKGLKDGFKGGEDAAEKSTKAIGDKLDKTKEKAASAGSGAGTAFGEALGGALDGENPVERVFDAAKGAGGILAAGAAIGGVFMAGLAQSVEQRQIGSMIAIQNGASREAGAKLGSVVGDAFANNFGDSMEQVGEALKSVVSHGLIDTSASEGDLKHLTEMAVTASQVVGEETDNIGRAAQQLLRNGLAKNAEDAMDLIVGASQRGVDVSHDLIDTIVEYSTQFRELGLSGPESMGLISQALQGGARDADTAADALKEFAIRGRDMSDTTVRGFQTIGLNAGQMGDAIAAGGDRAHQALNLTLDGLRNIHDPVTRDQAAVDLFGTKAEDLANALQSMDLDTAAAQMDGYASATQKAADDAAAATPVWDTLWRNLSRVPENALEWATQSDAIDELNAKVRKAVEEKQKAAENEDTFGDRVAAAEDAVRRSTDAIAENTLTLDENITKHEKAANGVLSLWSAQNQHADAVQKANEAVKENGKNLDFNTEKGRANREALSDVAKSTYDTIAAMEKQGSTAQEIQGVVAAQRDEFIRLAEKMGMSANEANNLANKLGLIPGDYKAKVYVDNANANQRIQDTYGLLAMLRDKTIHLSVQETRFISKEAQFGRFAHGGIVGGGPLLRRAEGGPGNSMIIQHEQGEEVTVHPNGSMVIPAGMSRAMMAGWGGGGGGGGQWREVNISFSGDLDTAFATAFMKLEANGYIRARAR